MNIKCHHINTISKSITFILGLSYFLVPSIIFIKGYKNNNNLLFSYKLDLILSFLLIILKHYYHTISLMESTEEKKLLGFIKIDKINYRKLTLFIGILIDIISIFFVVKDLDHYALNDDNKKIAFIGITIYLMVLINLDLPFYLFNIDSINKTYMKKKHKMILIYLIATLTSVEILQTLLKPAYDFFNLKDNGKIYSNQMEKKLLKEFEPLLENEKLLKANRTNLITIFKIWYNNVISGHQSNRKIIIIISSIISVIYPLLDTSFKMNLDLNSILNDLYKCK